VLLTKFIDTGLEILDLSSYTVSSLSLLFLNTERRLYSSSANITRSSVFPGLKVRFLQQTYSDSARNFNDIQSMGAYLLGTLILI
jgi:hypothetical protein